MGFILSKFRKSKTSIKDTLDEIETDLRKLSRYQYDTELQQKRIIGRVVLFGSFLYVMFLVLAYFFGIRDLSLQEALIWIIPIIFFPGLLIAVKRVLGWYFNRKIVKNKGKYEHLKKEKQRLLDEVMEKETFKVAKEILEKYAPNHLLPKYLADQQRASPSSLTPIPRTRTSDGLRRRPISSTPMPYGGYGGGMGMGGYTPRTIRPFASGSPGPGQLLRQPANNFGTRPIPAIMPGPGPAGGTPGPMFRGPPPPRFMLPPPPSNPQYRTRKTGWLDKMVDYVVGDGPANRFALICRYCATHNGLATPEDFPYIGYRCVYCRQFNPPRQQRPSAATLPKNTVLIEEMDSTIKSPDSTLNESGNDDKSENPEESDIDNKDNLGEDAESKDENGDANSANDSEPVVELAGSSTEDLRKSVESLMKTDCEEQSGNEEFENEDETPQDGETSQLDKNVSGQKVTADGSGEIN